MLETCGSTQDLAIEAAGQGDPGRHAFLAHTQTAGRGSRGRQWQAPAGNLNLSVLLRQAAMAPNAAAWALRAGVALHSAVNSQAQLTGRLVLKWPNDLLLNDAKLGGILIDSALDAAGHVAWVVVGVGVNIAASPALPGRLTTCLASVTPKPITAEALAAAILRELDFWAGQTFDRVRAAWLARAHPLGTMLAIETPHGETPHGETPNGETPHGEMPHRRVEGRFAGLAADGALLLEGLPAPLQTGEVFLATVHAPPDEAV